MYLGLILVVLAVIFVVGGILSGGAFTLVLLPLAAIALVTAVVLLVAARAAGLEQTLTPTKPQEVGRIPRGAGPPAGQVPVTPDEYVEARQKSQ